VILLSDRVSGLGARDEIERFDDLGGVGRIEFESFGLMTSISVSGKLPRLVGSKKSSVTLQGEAVSVEGS
jgi:hypothetical protein